MPLTPLSSSPPGAISSSPSSSSSSYSSSSYSSSSSSSYSSSSSPPGAIPCEESSSSSSFGVRLNHFKKDRVGRKSNMIITVRITSATSTRTEAYTSKSATSGVVTKFPMMPARSGRIMSISPSPERTNTPALTLFSGP